MTRQASLFRGSGLPPHLKPHFDAFWKAYPPRMPNPKALAEAAFAEAVKAGRKAEDLVATAANYAAECKQIGTNPAYIPHAATFLRQGRFLDYLPAAVAAVQAGAGTGQAHEAHDLWPALKDRMSVADFRAWIAKCTPRRRHDGEVLELIAPSRFMANHIRAHFMAVLRPLAPQVRVVVEGEEPDPADLHPDEEDEA